MLAVGFTASDQSPVAFVVAVPVLLKALRGYTSSWTRTERLEMFEPASFPDSVTVAPNFTFALPAAMVRVPGAGLAAWPTPEIAITASPTRAAVVIIDRFMPVATQKARSGSRVTAVAAEVLRGNDAGRYTLPSRSIYPHQWNWDSALAALGWAELDPARAWTELESLAGARDRDGMIPHIAFRSGLLPWLTAARYLPGRRWWGKRTGADGRRISGITQPPLAATCMRLLFEDHPDERRARALLEPLHGWHSFLLDARDPHGHGEPVLIHPWESGRDNAVEWDAPLWRVLPEVAVVRRRDTDSVDAAERPGHEHYRRFLTLVRQGTAAGWDQRELASSGRFRVLDAGFSAILARACLDLAHVAEELGEARIAEESRSSGERVAAALAPAPALTARSARWTPWTRRRCPSRAPDRHSPCSRPAWPTSRSRWAGPWCRRRARVAVRRPVARPGASGVLGAQLLARPRVGQHHVADRARARAPRRRARGARAGRAHAARDRRRRDARVLLAGIRPRAGGEPLHVDGGAVPPRRCPDLDCRGWRSSLVP